MNKTLFKRITMMCIGVLIMGFAVSLCVYANLGTDPCTCLNLGLSSVIGLSFGTWQLIFNSVVLIFTFFLARHLIGIATIVNMVAIGFLVDYFSGVLKTILPSNPTMATRVLVMICGVVVLAFTVSLYIYPSLGVSPYDSIAIMLSKFTHIKFHWCRIFCDVAAVLVGFFCGSVIGIGTIITAFCLGPLIKLFNHLIVKIMPMEVKTLAL
jgi:hypothetical protein